MMSAGEADHPAVARGIKWLQSHQGEDGLWPEEFFTGDRKSVVKGKSVDHCVTGVQTCALPIYDVGRRSGPPRGRPWDQVAAVAPGRGRPLARGVLHRRSEERREGKECRSLCDWSSDVCSSDL